MLTLIVNNREFEFTRFDEAIEELEKKYGFEGRIWDVVKETKNLISLRDYLVIEAEVQAVINAGKVFI